ncbi:RraA family protein [Microvirga lotononidis]|uniref:Putative 4-hydroxy-4-methyl-2-oxoglutarate aldolase n=1 Tax=Microvirga lotononidis TaxID=864069 RepID=I4Z4D0_9HYPH|nr:RraA family protein [Microvirga lotononidis]EIM31072.1 Demethylmenaquinone methyltransferase [Microvirga lotononidis]WQO30523.1 RraA family protein [Microvirga lotononidis]
MIEHPRNPATDDAELFARLAHVQPATLGHHVSGGALSPQIRALVPVRRMVGRALTVRQPLPDSTPVFRALEALRRGDILVIDRQGDHHIACVGEMVALAAHHAGAAGVVVDGVVTDIEELREIGMPIYARGTNVITARVMNQPGGELFGSVTIGGSVISSGDILFGDANGILRLDGHNPNLDKLVARAMADEHREIGWRVKLAERHSLGELNRAL